MSLARPGDAGAMGAPPSRAGSLPLVGGALALDFCNTSSGRGTAEHLDHLRGPGDVAAWARHAGVVDAGAASALADLWRRDPDRGGALLARACALRDAVFRVDAALAAGGSADPADLDAVVREQAACSARGRLAERDGRFGWRWDAMEAPEEAVLGPVVASALAVLLEADRTRLKRCPGHGCGWLFLDATKNRGRRWCEMEVCGNRAKQRRRRGRAGEG